MNSLLGEPWATYACKSIVKLNSYDLERSTLASVLHYHNDDINSVCWDNKANSHIVYTAGDDCMCYVWDKRILEQKPVGAFIGHQEGITSVASRGDSRYVITNGKDQLLKQWDIRKINTVSQAKDIKDLKRVKGFDYRFMNYPLRGTRSKHLLDRSVSTFSGHYVLGSLIKCYYSPKETTAQRFIYTGSADGRVYVFDTLSEHHYSLGTEERSEHKELDLYKRVYKIPIRDVSWHPYFPLLVGSKFNGTINMWSYKHSYVEKEEKDNLLEELLDRIKLNDSNE